MPPPTMICPRCWGRAAACPTCDGAGHIPDVQLSPHFRLSELVASATARAQGIPNMPGPEAIENLRALALDTLEPMREAAGCALVVSSGYRSPRLNALVGGSRTTAHVHGLAADVKPSAPSVSLAELARRTIDAGVPFDQLILEPAWVHVGRRNPAGGVRGQRLMQLVRGGKYLPLDLNDPRALALA